ncbi:helicase-associated domain-containing protein [Bacillus piscicola]|uniref:helicase-associated domain-containing protein n=1 Tax=Bacillus piscicola TaxID=1632684 RepID=UPI001F098610|nr:helicase-associated domain-containing protein [Bacillus piscicola]
MYMKPLVIHPESRNIYVLEALDKEGNVGQQLIEFADLIQAPEQVHTYALTPYALWTAKAKGIDPEYIISFLEQHSQNIVPEWFQTVIKKNMNHFGALQFSMKDDSLLLKARTEDLINEIKAIEGIHSKTIGYPDSKTLLFRARYRKEIKKLLFEHELFAKDIVYEIGEEVDITCTENQLLDYQLEAVNSYLTYSHQAGGSGTIMMPPNSGKIIVGIKIIEELKTSTLIITEDRHRAEKWKNEIIEKTDLAKSNITLFSKEDTKLKPITIGTYETFAKHVDNLEGFGFIIYDDAHNLPTPTHEKTADIQAKNKLALASTLARSDGNGYFVLALIGPRWYEVLYRTLVNQGHQVPVRCIEIKVPLPKKEWREYVARDRKKSVTPDTLNSNKYKALSILLKKEKAKRLLVVSFFTEVTSKCSELFEIETLSTQLDEEQRKYLINAFNERKINKLISPSKLIENMPFEMVEVMIALSHQQGSEREEYLRLGKLLPAEEWKEEAVLYSLVSLNTDEERYYSRRRRRLVNFGFQYRILTFEEVINRGEFFES